MTLEEIEKRRAAMLQQHDQLNAQVNAMMQQREQMIAQIHMVRGALTLLDELAKRSQVLPADVEAPAEEPAEAPKAAE
jgi:hypothetical protein